MRYGLKGGIDMDRLSRKDFLKLAGFTVLVLAGCKFGDAATQTQVTATAGQPVNAAAGSAATDGISRAKCILRIK